MPNARDARRRWRGLFCLVVAAGLLIWGELVLQPVLRGVGFLIYWTACFLFTLAAIAIALLDIRATRRRVREEHRELLQRALDGLEAPPPAGPVAPPSAPPPPPGAESGPSRPA